MSGRFKLTMLIALICSTPSLFEFMKGYLVLSDLLTHVLIALLFSVIAMSFLSTIVALFTVQNIQQSRSHQMDDYVEGGAQNSSHQGARRELPEGIS